MKTTLKQKVNFANFHNFTTAVFTPCVKPDREPDFVSDSGSEYWDLGDRVVRLSDHWGWVKSCSWTFGEPRLHFVYSCGECLYKDFTLRFAKLTIDKAEQARRTRIKKLSVRPRKVFTIKRRVSIRRPGGWFGTLEETLTCKIIGETAQFWVTSVGKIGKSTIVDVVK